MDLYSESYVCTRIKSANIPPVGANVGSTWRFLLPARRDHHRAADVASDEATRERRLEKRAIAFSINLNPFPYWVAQAHAGRPTFAEQWRPGLPLTRPLTHQEVLSRHAQRQLGERG